MASALSAFAVGVLAALVKSGCEAIADAIGSAVALWYCQRATAQTLSAISDAAALAANATDDASRMAAAVAWQKALSTPKVTQ